MGEYKLGAIERKFAELIWRHEPLSSGQLVKLCQQELNWKKSTTYTVLRRLCQRGIFQNRDSVVTSLLTEQEFDARQSQQFVEEAFDGSLPKFLAAFTRQKKLTEREIEELEQLIRKNGR
ncbi:BlaI/MecI/CopY family transcriptional regulator [uncultured Dysosmobacter sp.]|uniref:BlaI/MecI/CopY family transcriptional regulator n=1 Tax=uncultured Dysosmobacter sp. TaxID=2591384 RepID=UPI00261AD3CE|nr:BlaI/MecI/CopY family transcriptional regulator [uncultured Dysosmobacter sp.]